MPAEAAADAASAAMGSDVGGQRTAAPRTKSLLGGLSRALGRKRPVAENDPSSPTLCQSLAVNATPEPSLDEPLDIKLANRPLETGSGAPDLNAIMRRVREERNQTTSAAPPMRRGRTSSPPPAATRKPRRLKRQSPTRRPRRQSQCSAQDSAASSSGIASQR